MRIFLIKIKWWLRLWLKQTFLEVISPFIDKSAVLQLFAYPFFVYLVWVNQGKVGLDDTLSNMTTEMASILLAIPLYIIFSGIRAVFITIKESLEEGKWDENTFVYSRPKRIFVKKVSAEQQEYDFLIKVHDAEPHSFVDFHVSYDKNNERVKSQIGNIFMSNWECLSSKSQCGSTINDKKEVTLKVRIEPKTVDTIIYVDVLSWSIR